MFAGVEICTGTKAAGVDSLVTEMVAAVSDGLGVSDADGVVTTELLLLLQAGMASAMQTAAKRKMTILGMARCVRRGRPAVRFAYVARVFSRK